MAKMFKASPTKAYKVEAIEYEGQKLISIRQHYKTVKEPDEWKPGYQGITFPVEGSAKIGAYLTKLAAAVAAGEVEFTVVEKKVKEPKEPKGKRK
jgi:hypothetical protein